jgi:hypothetical protein
MIDCRGRNGWFKKGGSGAGYHPITGKAWVGLFSKRQVAVPPIYLEGPPEEMAGLLRKLADQVELIGVAAQTPSVREGSSRIFWIFALVQDVGFHGLQSRAAA